MKPHTFAALLTVIATVAIFLFGTWIGLRPKAAFAGAAIFAVAYLGVAIPFINKAQRAAQAAQGEVRHANHQN